MSLSRVALAIAAIALLPAHAQAGVHYCVEQTTVGLHYSDGEYVPGYDDTPDGRRYSISFTEDYSEMSGVQGSKTVYRCKRAFPNKAPDVVTCINPLVATMSFNYSIETGRFTYVLTGPGGWLSEGTARSKDGRLADTFIFGKCQNF